MAETKALTLKEVEHQLTSAPNLRAALTTDVVRDRAIKNYEATTGRKDGANKFEAEVFAYMEIINAKPELAKIDRMYHFGAIVKCMTTGLSFRDGKLYVQPSGNGIKVDPSPAGRREMLEMMPSIKEVPEPGLVTKGDLFVYDELNKKIVKHIKQEESLPADKLDNIVAAYCRIYYKDGSIKDVVVYHHDLVKAKSKSKAKSDQSAWNEWPGEMCKKVPINRGFRLYHKYSDNVVIIPTSAEKKRKDSYDDDDDDFTPHEEVTVDKETGEVVDTKTEKKDDEPFV